MRTQKASIRSCEVFPFWVLLNTGALPTARIQFAPILSLGVFRDGYHSSESRLPDHSMTAIRVTAGGAVSPVAELRPSLHPSAGT